MKHTHANRGMERAMPPTASTAPMSTEEYLRTEVFGEQDRMQQKRMANLERLENRPGDGPISMEEYVRHVVFAEDLPDSVPPVAVPLSDPASVLAAGGKGFSASGISGGNVTVAYGEGAVAAWNNSSIATGIAGIAPRQPMPRLSAPFHTPAAFSAGTPSVSLPGMWNNNYSAAPLQPAIQSGSSVLHVVLQRDAQGRIVRKVEGFGGRSLEHRYAYDAQGHLTKAWLNGRLVELYVYNEHGQRVADATMWRGERELVYGAAGRLVQAGDTTYEYSPEGSLCRRIRNTRQGTEVTTFTYGADTRLDSVILPDGTQITYYYGSALGPVEKHVNGVLAESYIWKDSLRLGAWIDHTRGTRCLFHYEEGHSPVAVTMEHSRGAATYRLGFDQIGSLKLVVLPDVHGGKLIKEMAYDSFGTMLSDSNPELFLPVGFASGLVDRHTGFIRFGYRDYSPELGRFTALDPARDMRGDGDLWDYCVDDPVNSVDPWGLETKGVGVGFSASGFGFGAGAGAMVVNDDKGNWGVEYYGDYGASSGFGVSGEASYQTTTAETIRDLAGKSQKAGASIAVAPSGIPNLALTVGVEKVKGDGYTGDSKSIGASWGGAFVAPVEAYAKQEHSKVATFISGNK